MMLRIPKPAYIRSQLYHRYKPDATLYELLCRLAELYRLDEIQDCYYAPRSTSLNVFVTTPQGKFVFRRHHLEEEAVAYEHEILTHLQKRHFPAPRMLLNRDGQAWTTIDDTLYGVYEFVEGYVPTNFVWLPATRRDIIIECGRTLARYHQAIADLIPTSYKWNAYRPPGGRRWREGDWFRQVLAEIRPLIRKSTATSPVDDFTRARIDIIERMLDLEAVVEDCSGLSKLVIHGDYAPWNVFFRSGQPPTVIDFNESRLELQVYDIMLATFWFAWCGDRLNQNWALAFQKGYSEISQLQKSDIELAGSIFQWVMARSLTERLHIHYLLGRPGTSGLTSAERQCKMCIFAQEQPQQLIAGLK